MPDRFGVTYKNFVDDLLVDEYIFCFLVISVIKFESGWWCIGSLILFLK